MPVYNGEEYIREAIKSVLEQSFEDFELIIIDDGSTDGTKGIIRSFDDKRIKLIENRHDFIGTLNMGLQRSTGKYIARMDADDIMHPDRLKIQYAIMEEEPEITVCGSWMQLWGKEINQTHIVQTVNGKIENPLLALLKQNVIFHPTVMLRRSFIESHSIVYRNVPLAEDYDMWIAIALQQGVFYVESQALLYYRISKKQVSVVNKEAQYESSLQLRLKVLSHLFERNSQYSELSLLSAMLKQCGNDSLIMKEDILSFCHSIFSYNEDRMTFQ